MAARVVKIFLIFLKFTVAKLSNFTTVKKIFVKDVTF